jgi:hypothetical protein
MKRNIARLVGTLAMGVWAVGAAQAQVGGPEAPRGRMPAALDLARERDARRAAAQPEIDMKALKVQLTAFEQIVNRDMAQAFPSPFALLQDVKGAYLPGFGVVFHLEMNLHPLRMISMFDRRPYSAEELQKAREAKLERIRELKARMSALLLGHGSKLTEMPADENVAMVVHLFNLPSESEGLPTQLVLETSRRELLEAQAQRMPAAEFEKRQAFLEF